MDRLIFTSIARKRVFTVYRFLTYGIGLGDYKLLKILLYILNDLLFKYYLNIKRYLYLTNHLYFV